VAGIAGTLTYDAENRLTSVAGVSYTYDGDERQANKDNPTATLATGFTGTARPAK